MSTVQEIKSAISQLTIEERAELIAELCGWSDDTWDRQMRADAAAGKFTALKALKPAASRAQRDEDGIIAATLADTCTSNRYLTYGRSRNQKRHRLSSP